MLELTTLGTYTIESRSMTLHYVDIPDEFLTENDPRTLSGQTVMLDGQVRTVAAVESHCVHWHPGMPNAALRRVGLVLKPAGC